MYCIYRENTIYNNINRHSRQFKETRDGRRLPMFPNGRAIIEARGGMYYAKATDHDVIAISADLDEVIKRVKYADSDVDIYIRSNGRTMSVKDFEYSKLPTLYRIAYSDTEKAGLIIALDWFKDARRSKIEIFYDFDEMVSFIKKKQAKDGNYRKGQRN